MSTFILKFQISNVKFQFEFKGREISQIGKSRCGEAKEFEFEFKGWEIIKIGESRCGEANQHKIRVQGWG